LKSISRSSLGPVLRQLSRPPVCLSGEVAQALLPRWQRTEGCTRRRNWHPDRHRRPRNGSKRRNAIRKCLNGQEKSAGAPGEIRTPDLLLRGLSKPHRSMQNQAFAAAPERWYGALSASIEHILHTTTSRNPLQNPQPRRNKTEHKGKE
jgi:hypothetical protein